MTDDALLSQNEKKRILVANERVKTYFGKAAAMTFATAFYLYLLPVAIGATVWNAIWIGEWRDGRHRHPHPGE